MVLNWLRRGLKASRSVARRRQGTPFLPGLEPLEVRLAPAQWSGDVFDTTPGVPLWTNTSVQEVVGDVHVPAGKTLTIQAGTVVKFDFRTTLTVDGTLNATGAAGQTIIFTSINDNTPEEGGNTAGPGSWVGIVFKSDSTGNVISDAVANYAGFNGSSAAIYDQGGALSLSNTVVSNSGTGGVRLEQTTATLSADTFTGNNGAAVSMDLDSNPTITGETPSLITGNNINGLAVDSGNLVESLTWDNTDIVYVLQNRVTVPNSMTLTIDAGQVVKLSGQGGGLTVDGTLDAQGTAASPVIFTSLKDDGPGGDTGNDNGASKPSAADWGDIQLDSDSTNNVLTYAEVLYAGFNGTPAAVYDQGGPLTLSNSTVSNSGSGGLRVEKLGQTTTTLSADTFTGNNGAAVSMDLDSNPTITGETPSLITGNNINGLAVDSGTLAENLTWNNPDIVYYLGRNITVPAGLTLAIDAGQVVKLLGAGLTVDGTLNAQGTAATPVIFTSLKDDGPEGDTGNDNGTSTPHAGDWGDIQLDSGSTSNVLSYVEVLYAGSNGTPAAVYDQGGPLTLSNSTVSNSGSGGLRVEKLGQTTTTLSADTFTGNNGAAVSMDLDSNPTITGETPASFSGNNINGLAVDGGTLAESLTWNNPDIVYVLQNSVTVPKGLTLTVGAGQVVKLSGAGLTVDGTLGAQGTVAAPVIFTSLKDDGPGGDTGNDNGASKPSAGNWGDVQLNSDSTNNVLSYVEVLYAGSNGTPAAVYDQGGPLTLSRSVVSHSGSGGVDATSGAQAQVIDDVITNNNNQGIAADTGAVVTAVNDTIDANGTGVQYGSATVTLTNDLITNSSNAGIVNSQNGGTVTVTFSDVYNPNAANGNYRNLANQTGSNNNLSADPSYLNESGGNFLGLELQPGSPVEDAGTSAGAPATDFLGNPRFKDSSLPGRGDGSGYDMGAFEVQTSVATDLQFSAAAYSAVDTDGPVTVTVTLIGTPPGSVTVQYATSDGSARAGTDYVATSGELTFASGVTSQTFTVPIIDRGPLGGPLSFNLTLSNPGGTGAVLGTPNTAVVTINGTGVVRTITYDQITSLPGGNAVNGGALLSADGNRAVFATAPPGGGTDVYTVRSDGTGLTLVDPNGGTDLDISADGSVILERISHGDSGDEFRVVNADGSNLHVAFDTETYSSDVGARLSADGKTIFFEDASSFTVNNVTYPSGVYSVSAAGGGAPQLIASQSQVAALIGTAANNVGLYNGEPGGLALNLGVSADGSRLVFEATVNNVGDFLVGVDANGSGLHTIGPVGVSGDYMAEDGISGDGSTVFRYDSVNEAPFQGTVYHFDGSGQVTLSVPGGLHANTAGPEHVELTQDGSKLLLGSSSLLINTDGSGMVQIGTDSGPAHLTTPQLAYPTMNGSGTEFLYAMTDLTDVPQLAVAHLNPTSLGGDPTVSNVSISPGDIVINPPAASTTTTISGQVGTSQSVYEVTDALLYNGVSSNNLSINNQIVDAFADNYLYDDGSHGDVTAGDGTYTDSGIGTEGTVPGPRTVRVTAQIQDGRGLLHATAVEVDGLTVVSQAPAAPTSSVNALPHYTASTSFPLSWSGSDGGGPGLAAFDIYVSDDGGPFALWQNFPATTTSATYTGQDGHTYGFSSVAIDNDGNVQATPAAAQATTLVDVTPPTSSVSALPTYTPTTSFTLSWSGSDGANGSGIATYSIFYTDNGGPITAFLTATAQTSATFTGKDGHIYTFYSMATDHADNVQPTPVAAQTSTTIILPADHLSISAPGQGIAGGKLAITVNAVNPDGFTDPLYHGSTALIILSGPTGGQLAGSTTAAFQNGVATFSNVSLNTAGSYQLLAASSDILVAGVTTFITVAPTTHFSVTSVPTATTAGNSFMVTVTALTAGGQTDTSYLGTIQATCNDPQVLPTTWTFTAADKGKKTLTLTLKTAGSRTITVADVTKATAAGTSAAIPVAAAAASTLQVTGYTAPLIANTAHTFTVTALDPYGNKALTYRGKIQFSTGGSPAQLPAAYTFVATDQGSRNFTVTFQTAGTGTLNAADTAHASIMGSEPNISVVNFSAGVSGPSQGLRFQPLTFTFSASETGAAPGANFTYKIDWIGNGTVIQTVTGGAMMTLSHSYTVAGNDTVRVTAVDSAGNATPAAATLAVSLSGVALQPDPADATKTALVIEGTTGNDTITITPADPTGMTVTVTINGVVQTGGPFAPTGPLLVYGQGGNDTIQEITKVIGGKTVAVGVQAVLFAGTGNTTLSAAGSSANNVLVGGGGKDSLTGGSGRDVLIGGGGASALHAGGGGDILIAGRTTHDADVAGLLAIAAEWGRQDETYALRLNDLFGGGSGALNGTALLNPQTITTAGGIDQLFGSLGPDWFWIAASTGVADKVNDFGLGDVVTFE